jgi:hypothetical protein
MHAQRAAWKQNPAVDGSYSSCLWFRACAQASTSWLGVSEFIKHDVVFLAKFSKV